MSLRRPCAGLLAAALIALPKAGEAQITAVSAPSPAPGSSLTARIRWGDTGFEASLLSGPSTILATLNPTGTPVWQLGTPYNFRVTYNSLSGSLGLDVDFDGKNGFDGPSAGTLGPEAISASTTFANQGFGYLTVSGNSGNSTLTNLVINGTSFPNITPVGTTFTESWFADAAPASVTITGTLTFTAAGTGDESPSWNVRFRSPQAVSVVPEPSSFALLGLGVAGLWAVRRRRSA